MFAQSVPAWVTVAVAAISGGAAVLGAYITAHFAGRRQEPELRQELAFEAAGARRQALRTTTESSAGRRDLHRTSRASGRAWQVGGVRFLHTVSAPDELWDGLLDGTVRTAPVLRGQPEPVRLRVGAAFERLLDDHRICGGFELHVSVKLAAAQRTSATGGLWSRDCRATSTTSG